MPIQHLTACPFSRFIGVSSVPCAVLSGLGRSDSHASAVHCVLHRQSRLVLLLLLWALICCADAAHCVGGFTFRLAPLYSHKILSSSTVNNEERAIILRIVGVKVSSFKIKLRLPKPSHYTIYVFINYGQAFILKAFEQCFFCISRFFFKSYLKALCNCKMKIVNVFCVHINMHYNLSIIALLFKWPANRNFNIHLKLRCFKIRVNMEQKV